MRSTATPTATPQSIPAELLGKIVFLSDREGATEEELQGALELQRKAQWRLDFIAAENSMGFHAPQEAARVLGEALDYARQGQVAALTALDAGGAEPAAERKLEGAEPGEAGQSEDVR